MTEPSTRTLPSHPLRLAVLLRLAGLGAISLVLTPVFAWLFQHEAPAGIAGAALFSLGASYIYLRKETTIPTVKAFVVALVVTGVVASVGWLLRPIWGSWLG